MQAKVVRATSAALDDIAHALPAPVRSISLRVWPLDFPDRQVLAELAHARGWDVHLYDAGQVVGQVVSVLAERVE